MSVPFSVANNWADFPEFQRAVVWKEESGRVTADVQGRVWTLRLNAFPDEPLYTLIVEEEEVVHFDDWPSFWPRPTDQKVFGVI